MVRDRSLMDGERALNSSAWAEAQARAHNDKTTIEQCEFIMDSFKGKPRIGWAIPIWMICAIRNRRENKSS
jgi:hypothetical protein